MYLNCIEIRFTNDSEIRSLALAASMPADWLFCGSQSSLSIRGAWFHIDNAIGNRLKVADPMPELLQRAAVVNAPWGVPYFGIHLPAKGRLGVSGRGWLVIASKLSFFEIQGKMECDAFIFNCPEKASNCSERTLRCSPCPTPHRTGR